MAIHALALLARKQQLKIYKRRFFNAEARDSFIPAGMSTGDILSICKPKEHRRLSTDTPEPEYNPTNLEDRLDIVRMEADAENDIDEVGICASVKPSH